MFLEIPRAFGRQELSVVHSMLKVPNNSFTRGAIFRMNDMGGPALISAQITCIASAMRAALTTLDGWERWMSELKTAALDYGYMGRWLRGEWWPTCWSSAPIAKHLQNVLDPDYWARTRLPAIAHAVRAVFARLGQVSPLAPLGFVDDVERTGALRRLAAALHVYRCVRPTENQQKLRETAPQTWSVTF